MTTVLPRLPSGTGYTKERDLSTALTALMQWGDRHLAGEAGPPAVLLHRACGHEAAAAVICPSCDQRLTGADLRLVDTAKPGGSAPSGLTAAGLTSP